MHWKTRERRVISTPLKNWAYHYKFSVKIGHSTTLGDSIRWVQADTMQQLTNLSVYFQSRSASLINVAMIVEAAATTC